MPHDSLQHARVTLAAIRAVVDDPDEQELWVDALLWILELEEVCPFACGFDSTYDEYSDDDMKGWG